MILIDKHIQQKKEQKRFLVPGAWRHRQSIVITATKILLLAYGFNATALAGPTPGKPNPGSTEFVMGDDKGSEYQLEVRQMPLPQVLKELTLKTHIPIHYSVLPEGLITATCVGSTIKPVLECLLDRKADIIVRYLHGKAGRADTGQIAEAWVLGSKLEAVPKADLCTASSGQGSMSLNRADRLAEDDFEAKPVQSDALLKMARSKNPQERAYAIGALLADGRQNSPEIKAILEEAVHDKDANVRAQAVSTLTHREDFNQNAKDVIQEALQDSSVDVRMMAVDGITDDVGLLQQAVNDEDEAIRTFASLKLEELLQKQDKK